MRRPHTTSVHRLHGVSRPGLTTLGRLGLIAATAVVGVALGACDSASPAPAGTTPPATTSPAAASPTPPQTPPASTTPAPVTSPASCATAGTPIGTDEFLKAWLTCDDNELKAMLTPAALTQLRSIGALDNMTWKKDSCEGAAGSTYCTYSNEAGAKLVVQRVNQGDRKIQDIRLNK